MASFAELIEKMGRGIKLTGLELSQLRDEARAVQEIKDLAKTWIHPTGGTTFDFPSLFLPRWRSSPLNLFIANEQTDTAIVNNTNTYISFDAVAQTSAVFSVRSSDTTYIDVAADVAAPNFGVIGYMTFVQNATGYRAAYLQGYDAAGASVGFTPLVTAAGQNLVDNVISFAYPAKLGVRTFRFFVFQSSGGNLTLKDFFVGMFLL